MPSTEKLLRILKFQRSPSSTRFIAKLCLWDPITCAWLSWMGVTSWNTTFMNLIERISSCVLAVVIFHLERALVPSWYNHDFFQGIIRFPWYSSSQTNKSKWVSCYGYPHTWIFPHFPGAVKGQARDHACLFTLVLLGPGPWVEWQDLSDLTGFYSKSRQDSNTSLIPRTSGSHVLPVRSQSGSCAVNRCA